MHILGCIAIIFLGGLTGGLTIWLFFKFLFRPLKPVKIFKLTIQGVLPKNQASIADQIGKIVSKEMQLTEVLQDKIAAPSNFERLKPEIELHIDDFLRNKLNKVFPILSNFIGDKTISQLKQAFMQELESMFPALLKNYAANLQNDLNIEQMVKDKINSISAEKIEAIIYENAGGKINTFIAGGYLVGCCIGLVQALIALSMAK